MGINGKIIGLIAVEKKLLHNLDVLLLILRYYLLKGARLIKLWLGWVGSFMILWTLTGNSSEQYPQTMEEEY